jgi:nitroreductase
MEAQLKLSTTVETMETIYRRRAVRSYAAATVDKATIRALLDAAVQAPTALHREPWAFVVIQDKEWLRRYSERGKVLLLEEARAMPYLRSTEARSAPLLADPAFNIFYDAGTLIVVCRKISGPFAEADCWLAAENLMLAATAKGLGTCCIGFAVNILNTAEVKRELGIPEGGAAVVPIIVGVPRAMPAPASRKTPEVLRWVS